MGAKEIAGRRNVVRKGMEVEKGPNIWAAANSSGWLAVPKSGARRGRGLQNESVRSFGLGTPKEKTSDFVHGCLLTRGFGI